MTFSAWLSVALLCTLGAMTPGPSLMVVLQHTVNGSRWQGAVTALAHGLGVGLYAFGVLAGLSALFAAFPTLERVLTGAGALYLAWLGAQALRADEEAVLEDESSTAVAATPARDGFLVAFLNPKVAAFFIALFAPFVDASGVGAYPLLLAATAWVIDTTWYLLVALVLSSSWVLPWLRRHRSGLNRATGAVLLAVAVVIGLGMVL